MTERDLSASETLIRDQYIRAVYPDEAAFRRRLTALSIRAAEETAKVQDFSGYRAVLKHFFNGFDDEHVGVFLNIDQTRLTWPGFVASYRGSGYHVTASARPEIANGAVISICDGRPIQSWIDEVSAYEGGHVGLESTNYGSALRLLVDNGNPFLRRPASCVIGGKPVALDWERLPYQDYARTVLPLFGTKNRDVSISPFGRNGAWVRFGNFQPENAREAAQFKAVVARLPAIRDKALIVLDVRQNVGGPYDWFMLVLEGLYGKSYADRFARARLAIDPVFRVTPEIVAMSKADDATDIKLGTVRDTSTEDRSANGLEQALASHRVVYRMQPPQNGRSDDGVPPVNPVKAHVVVVTDYGCASACIGFVDELKRFPSVKQVGVETFVDSRTGTPLTVQLPSGNGRASVAIMTRDGRERDDNLPQKPDLVFKGDPLDTKAEKKWILNVVRPKL